MVLNDPARNVQEEEDVLMAGVAVCSAMSVCQDGWSSFSLRLSMAITCMGTLR